jgi:hypothetical protein
MSALDPAQQATETIHERLGGDAGLRQLGRSPRRLIGTGDALVALDSPPMLVRRKPLLTIAALVLALAAAAPAAAQQAPSLGAPETQTNVAPPPETDTTGGDGGLKTWQEVLIFGAGLVLLLGIGFAIVGDARDRAARLGRRRAEPETAGAGVPHKHRQQAKQRARAKARAAKAQRRRNR